MKPENRYIQLLNFILLSLLVVTIAVHLFGVHSKLLYHLNPDKVLIDGRVKPFTFTEVDENNITAIIFALTYSIATAIILVLSFKSKTLLFIIVAIFGMLDGFGVFIYYNLKNFDNSYLSLWGGLYYALYTIAIIISAGYYRIKRDNITDDKIITPIKTGVITRKNSESGNIGIVEGKNVRDDILRMVAEGNKTQMEIANELGCSQALVSKIVNLSKNNQN